MSRADAWGDAGEIMEQYAGTTHIWVYSQEIALRTSLTQDKAEDKLLNAVQQIIGDLLYLHGHYSEGEDE